MSAVIISKEVQDVLEAQKSHIESQIKNLQGNLKVVESPTQDMVDGIQEVVNNNKEKKTQDDNIIESHDYNGVDSITILWSLEDAVLAEVPVTGMKSTEKGIMVLVDHPDMQEISADHAAIVGVSDKLTDKDIKQYLSSGYKSTLKHLKEGIKEESTRYKAWKEIEKSKVDKFKKLQEEFKSDPKYTVSKEVIRLEQE